ncbi:MAG: hypothetical protein E6I43_12940 [Chloroflexi bacterium]|nr:MAG: hypothetical protein E6I43_12940 [Chloroflexota bacterium]
MRASPAQRAIAASWPSNGHSLVTRSPTRTCTSGPPASTRGAARATDPNRCLRIHEQAAGRSTCHVVVQRPSGSARLHAELRRKPFAASTLNVDGVTEIRAPYSNFGGAGIIDIGAPSDSQLGAAYNPPVSYGTVTATDRTSGDFPPDAPSHWTVQTTTSGPAAAGATGLVVANSAGFAVNQFIVVDAPGAPGTEFSMVTAIPDATHLSVTPLKNGHAAGTAVFGGPANSLSNFGGTSSATPLSAGLGALLLTVRPSLTWVQVRDILRGTAVHIDAANTDPVGIWRDANGVASNQPGYTGPVYSRWYGFGRIDALAAVNGVLTLGATADLIIRDNLGDSGLVPSVGRFWDSPDIWVRNLSPAAEGAAALPANYATPGPTQDVAASHDNYIYARVKNIGPVATSDFYLPTPSVTTGAGDVPHRRGETDRPCAKRLGHRQRSVAGRGHPSADRHGKRHHRPLASLPARRDLPSGRPGTQRPTRLGSQ